MKLSVFKCVSHIYEFPLFLFLFIRGVFGKYKDFCCIFVLNSSVESIFCTCKLLCVIHMWCKENNSKETIIHFLSFHRNHMMHTRSTSIFSHLNCWLHRLFVINSYSFIETNIKTTTTKSHTHCQYHLFWIIMLKTLKCLIMSSLKLAIVIQKNPRKMTSKCSIELRVVNYV